MPQSEEGVPQCGRVGVRRITGGRFQWRGYAPMHYSELMIFIFFRTSVSLQPSIGY